MGILRCITWFIVFVTLTVPGLAYGAEPTVPAQLPGIGIAANKPVFGGACKACPWGVVADVVKNALKLYGHDVQICYSCSQADAPRIVGDARIPGPIKLPDGLVLPQSYFREPPKGRVEFGAVSAQGLLAAYHGTGAYKVEGPRSHLRLLANIDSPLFLLVAATRKSGITSLDQLKTHKGPLKIVGAEDLAAPIFEYYQTSADALRASGAQIIRATGQFSGDLIIQTGNLANSSEFNVWYAASQNDDLVYFQLPEALLNKMAKDLDMERRMVPVGLLRGLETPIPTVARTGTVIYGRTDMPDAFAYTVAKALDEQQDLLEWAMGNYRYNRYRVTKAGDVPLHPGAARYYKERGYLN